MTQLGKKPIRWVQQHIFYRVGGNIWHVFWDSDSGMHTEQWTGPGSMTAAQTGTQTVIGDPATLLGSNQQHIFYRATGGNIWQIFEDPASGMHMEQWTGPGSLTAAQTGTQTVIGNPATMVFNNQRHIFYRANGGSIWHVYWDPGSGMNAEQWTGPGSMTAAHTGTQVAEGDPVTMVTPIEFTSTPWQQHIFYRVYGSIWHVFWDSSSGMQAEQWTGPGSMTAAQTGTQIAVGDPVTMVTRPNSSVMPNQLRQQQHIFYRADNGNIWHVYWDSESGMHAEQWTGPGSLTAAQTGTQTAVGDPVTMLGNYQQHIFYRADGSNIWHVYWDPGSGMNAEQWTGPGSMTAVQTGTQTAVGNPVTLISDEGLQQLHVFYCDTAKDSIHIFWSRYSSNLIVENWTGQFIVAPPKAAGDLVTMGT